MSASPAHARPNDFSPDDRRFMRRALRLAERGFTPPNPMVGCVIVKDGHIVGEGWHPLAGAPHAEVFALRQAGDMARGATAYVTLEPCSHFGRTPPCSSALVAAGVARVVAATRDPYPKVAGQGFEDLRRAGIAVQVGLLEAEARRLNEAFFHYHATGRPFVILKAAMTLDGKIATRTGDSRWVSGEAARAWTHRLRARCGAILCGIGTVLADDALLTARFPGVPRQPLRVILDSDLRLPVESRIVQTAAEVPTIVATTEAASEQRAKNLQSCQVEIVRLPADTNKHIRLDILLAELARREIVSILVEGGGAVHESFLIGRHADRLLWFVAPKLVGGREAPTPVEGLGVERMADAIPMRDMRVRRIGGDVLLSCVPDYGSP